MDFPLPSSSSRFRSLSPPPASCPPIFGHVSRFPLGHSLSSASGCETPVAVPCAVKEGLRFTVVWLFCVIFAERLSDFDTMHSDNSEELFPVVDLSGRVIGRATRGECHGGSMLLHPVVHLHVFNSRGELYLQRRPAWKDIQPGRWDTAVGGHVAWGERIDEALRREAREELGLETLDAEMVAVYDFRSEREYELVHVFRTCCDGEIRPSDELDGGRFWTADELRASVGKGVLTPNFEGEMELILK